MKISLFIISIITTFTFISCQGITGPTGPPGSNGNNDKQIRFSIPASMGNSSTTPFIMIEGNSLIKFNIADYAGVDSVVVSAYIRSHNTNTNCVYDLYDRTDSTHIVGSLVQTDSLNYQWVTSGNFFSQLPKKEISLSSSLTSQTNGVLVEVGAVYLFLYRK